LQADEESVTPNRWALGEVSEKVSESEIVERSLLAAVQRRHDGIADMLQRRLEKASTTLTNSAHALAEAARAYDSGNADAIRLLEPGVTS
jgi:hypothetical protein